MVENKMLKAMQLMDAISLVFPFASVDLRVGQGGEIHMGGYCFTAEEFLKEDWTNSAALNSLKPIAA